MKVGIILTLAILGLAESVRGQDFGNQVFAQFNGVSSPNVDNSLRHEDTTATSGTQSVVPTTFGSPEVAPVKIQTQDDDGPATVKPQGGVSYALQVGIDRGGIDRFKKTRERVGRQ